MTPDAAQRLTEWFPPAPLWVLVALGLALVAVSVAPLWVQRGQPLRRRLVSVALRGAASLALIPLLGGLSSVEVRQLTTRSRVVVLLDGSASMMVRDAQGTRADKMAAYLVRQRPVLEQLAQQAQLEILWLGLDHVPLGPEQLAALPPADGLRTDYLAALERLTEQGRRPAAVVLLGDGADRGSLGLAADRGDEAVAALLEEISFPVFTLCLGGSMAGDLRVEIGDHAPFAFLRRPMNLPVLVHGVTAQTGPVQVVLRREGRVLSTRQVDPGRSGDPGPVVFEVTPDEAGYLTLTAEVAVPDGDPLPANNADATTIRVVRDRTRVLQLSSHPSWDVRFARRFLKTDPNIDLISFFIMREAMFFGRYGSSRLSLIEFPHDELFGEDLPGFDLVILQNFSFGSLPRADMVTAEYLEALAGFVEGGGGLLIIGGDRALDRGEYGGTGIDRVLPCDWPVTSGSSGEPFQAVPTAAGLRHPVTRLAANAEANAQVWASLAALADRNPLGTPRTGTAVLATAGDGGDPLIAVREVGKGRVMVLGTDGSWTWTSGEGGAASSSHAALLRNAVRWLVGEQDDGRLDVRTGRENVQPGQDVRVAVELRDRDYEPRPGAPVRVQVQALDRPDLPLRTLDGITGDDGRWSVALPVEAAGTYRVAATEVDGDAVAEARFTARPDLEEFDHAEPRPALMRQLARSTGGRVLDADEILDPVQLGPGPAVTRSVTDVVPLWDRWWWMVAAAVGLGLDWILRRRWAMA